MIFATLSYANAEDKIHNHGKDHDQIFHAFTLELNAGKANNGKSKNFDFSGWIGGDYNRLWINSDKKKYGNFEEKLEIQALYSRNISQFWDSQIGISHDFSSDYSKKRVNHFTLGFEGLAPQMFETRGHILLSEKGNLSLRLKQEIDIFLTQRLIAQPFIETEIFAQEVKELEIGSGISSFEIGINTRYEISRKFAPYLGLLYHAKTFSTANLAKKKQEKVNDFILLAGLRIRF